MNFKLFVIFIAITSSTVSSAPPVFLESAGKICTLNNVGKVPTGKSVSYPVYQKVCRQIIPRMGDEVIDDEMNEEDVTNNGDGIEMIRQAILGITSTGKSK